MPAAVCDELVIGRDEALTGTQALRFGLGEFLNGSMAGMFDGESNIEPASSPAGFVVDVSGCGTDDRVLRFAMLAGQRAVSQMLAGVDAGRRCGSTTRAGGSRRPSRGCATCSTTSSSAASTPCRTSWSSTASPRSAPRPTAWPARSPTGSCPTPTSTSCSAKATPTTPPTAWNASGCRRPPVTRSCSCPPAAA